MLSTGRHHHCCRRVAQADRCLCRRRLRPPSVRRQGQRRKGRESTLEVQVVRRRHELLVTMLQNFFCP